MIKYLGMSHANMIIIWRYQVRNAYLEGFNIQLANEIWHEWHSSLCIYSPNVHWETTQWEALCSMLGVEQVKGHHGKMWKGYVLCDPSIWHFGKGKTIEIIKRSVAIINWGKNGWVGGAENTYGRKNILYSSESMPFVHNYQMCHTNSELWTWGNYGVSL